MVLLGTSNIISNTIFKSIYFLNIYEPLHIYDTLTVGKPA